MSRCMTIMKSISKQNRVYILKSENDERQYRGLMLNNGMKVILISDLTTEKAAASLDVHIGSMANLEKFACLFQRMLYLTNSSKQPRFFKNYVETHNGSVGAEIQMEFASYYFDIDTSEFKNALGFFADFFTKLPDFDEAVGEQETLIIKHEHKMKLKDERKTTIFVKWIRKDVSLRKTKPIYETAKELINTKMDFKKLMMTFHKKYYGANVMKLCVLGKESLDELEDLVVNLFSEVVKNEPALDLSYLMPPYSSVHEISYVRYSDYKRLYMIFDLSYTDLRYCYCSVEHFLAYLFEYDMNGTLLFYLKNKGLANSIKAGSLVEIKNTFSLCIDLTDEGYNSIDVVMILIFQYIDMLRKSKRHRIRRVFNEYKELLELRFRFKEKEPCLKYVKTTARSMQEWPLKYVLRGKQMPIKWDGMRNAVKDVFNNFSWQQYMSISMSLSKKHKVIIGQKNRIRYMLTDKAELYNYYNHKIEELRKIPHDIKIDNIIECFMIEFNPPCNKFISRNIKPLEDKTEQFPTVIKNTKLLKLWYKRDDEFNVPKATMIFHFTSSICSKNAHYANLTNMFVLLINKSLFKQYGYFYTSLLDIHWELCSTPKGILLKIHGYDNELPLLLEKIIDQMINFTLDDTHTTEFEIASEKNLEISLKKIKEFRKKPHQQVETYLSFLFTECSQENQEEENLYQTVTIGGIPKLSSNILSDVYVEGLIHGNFTKIEALNIAHMIETKFSNATPSIITPSITTLKMLYDVTLKDENHLIFHMETFSPNSCTLVFYQTDERSIKWNMMLELIQKIFEKFFDTLTDKEIPDNIVRHFVYRSNGMQGLTFLIQGLHKKNYTHENTEKRIDELMHFMMDHMAKMSQEKFEAIKTLMIKKCHAKKPKTLNDLSNAFWSEIWEQQYNFDRLNVEIDQLREITLHDLCCVMKKFMNVRSPKLSIRMTSVQNDFCKTKPVYILRRYIGKIEVVAEFKATQMRNHPMVKALDFYFKHPESIISFFRPIQLNIDHMLSQIRLPSLTRSEGSEACA